MGDRQHKLGLDHLPLANGGRTARIFEDKRPFRDGRVQDDRDELLGIVRDLGVRSTIGVPLELGDNLRGVLVVASATPDYFTSDQLSLLQFVGYWIGLVAREHASLSVRLT